MTRRPTCLVLRALGLGDLLTAVPALRGLRAGLPGHEIVLAAPPTIGAFARAEGLVDRAVDAVPWRLPDLGPVDVAVNLHGRGPQSTRLLESVRPRCLWAYGRPPGPVWRDDEHEVDRWVRLLRAYDLAADPADLRLRPDPPGEHPALAVIHPGAAAEARRWPAPRFAAVAAGLRRVGWEVAVTAGPGEAGLAASVAAAARLPVGSVLAGLTLPALADLLQRAGLLVVGDTGVGHLGTACGTPSVRLFGPVDPARWGPTVDLDRHVVLWCGDGRGDPHGATADPALERIGVEDVLQAVPIVTARRPLGMGLA